ncbi:molecular chaperone MKKS-like isoform X2 [Mercenaria mercenaria]|uniref:molecular chaperone MKKS-like isoform X2 n=1 Tax=Mercenaria mercenaria TaxID=6596 RepID=UPI00234E7D86|nr:molecular chaperone MKKS-like isoform X2 [Mercenaria mercenaria]
MTLTSSSKRLLQSLSVRKPIIQLLVSATQGHLSAYSDGGLFLASLASDLVLRSVDSNQNAKILAEVYETFLTLSLEYLNSDVCAFKYKAMMSDIKFMKSFVKSVLGTKSLCQWDKSKLEHVSNIVLETFLQCLSDDSQSMHASDVFVMATLELDMLESKSMCGLLLPAPELSKFKVKPLIKAKTVGSGQSQDYKSGLNNRLNSLSGDLDELSGVKYEVSQDISVDTEMLERLSGFCDSIVQSNVGLVLCQKVIHPKLKLILRKS